MLEASGAASRQTCPSHKARYHSFMCNTTWTRSGSGSGIVSRYSWNVSRLIIGTLAVFHFCVTNLSFGLSFLQLDISDDNSKYCQLCTALEADGNFRPNLDPQGGYVMSSSDLHEVDGHTATAHLHSRVSSGDAQQMMTFKPAISKRAHELPSRSVEELSEGDRLRRDCYLVCPVPCICLNS